MLIVKTFEIDSAHRLMGTEEEVGDCGFIHGHRYKIEIGISGEPNNLGFVINFKDLKRIVKKLDHKIFLNEKDPLINPIIQTYSDEKKDRSNIIVLPGNPSVEMLAALLAGDIKKELDLLPDYIQIWETASAYTVWQNIGGANINEGGKDENIKED